MFTTVQAQYHFEHFDGRDGMSQTSVRAIVQDSTGYIWLGTFGGVNRYDGYSFKAYRHQSNDSTSLPNDDVTSLVVDNHQNLWIGTSSGLSCMDLSTQKLSNYYSSTSRLVGDAIRSLYMDKEERIWVGTKDKGICYYDCKNKQFVVPPVPVLPNVRALAQTSDGSIYYGSFARGVQSFKAEGRSSVSSLMHYDLGTANIYFLYEEEDVLYAGTSKGLYRKTPTDSVFHVLNQPRGRNDFFRSILKTNSGYWLGTLDGLIHCASLDDIQTGHYHRHLKGNNPKSMMTNSYILSLYMDRSQQLWVGTEDGLERYDSYANQFRALEKTIPSGDYVPHITEINSMPSGKLLLGTRYPGLLYEDDEAFKPYLSQQHRVTDILRVGKSHYYIGLGDGSFIDLHMSPKRVHKIALPDCSTPVFAITKLDQHRILCGTRGDGVYLYDFKRQEATPIFHSVLSKMNVAECIHDIKGRVWIATDHGIVSLSSDLKRLQLYLSKFSEDKEDVSFNDLHIDSFGNVWAGSKRGLYMYDPVDNRFILDSSLQELTTAWVTNIETDSLQRLWLNLNYNQIARYDRLKQEVKTYYVANGVRSNVMNTHGFYKADEHRIYIGGEKGIYTFDPLGVQENIYSPKPYVSSVRVNNKEITPGDSINGEVPLMADINYGRKIELSFQNRNVSFQVSSASYVHKISDRYKYRLRNASNKWTLLPSRSRNISFVKLPPGKHLLEIQSCNNNGNWSDVGRYLITVRSPWWATWWAFCTYILFAALIALYILTQARRRRVLREALMMEQVKREHTEALNEDKLRFFTNISHELRTPLTLILGPAHQLAEDKSLNDQAHRKVIMLRRHAQRMLSLINQILDFRKAETGDLQLKVRRADIYELSYKVHESFSEFAASKEIAFRLHGDQTEINGYLDSRMYMTVLYNLLSNALKFTPHKGHVNMYISEETREGVRHLIVRITDDGIGIPKESQADIFSRFFQASNSQSSTTGSGIGLSLVQRIVELHGGKITFDSVEGHGTTFHIVLPIDKKAYGNAVAILDTYDDELLMEFSDEEEIVESPTAETVENQEVSSEGALTILLVEDNDELRAFAAGVLSKHYRVEQARDGIEGLEKCRQFMPNLCVVDVMMPRLDGFGFLETLKKDADISHIPVVMLTAMGENRDRMLGYKLGADAYLAKPFDPQLLMSRIENILDNRRRIISGFSSAIPDAQVSVVEEAVSITHSPADEAFIKKMTVLIESNMSNPEFTVQEFSREMGMSTSKLYRKMKGLTDMSPNEYLRTIRLKEAARLLSDSTLNVSEIAYSVGFGDPLYFSRCFKKQFGKAPRDLREQ